MRNTMYLAVFPVWNWKDTFVFSCQFAVLYVFLLSSPLLWEYLQTADIVALYKLTTRAIRHWTSVEPEALIHWCAPGCNEKLLWPVWSPPPPSPSILLGGQIYIRYIDHMRRYIFVAAQENYIDIKGNSAEVNLSFEKKRNKERHWEHIMWWKTGTFCLEPDLCPNVCQLIGRKPVYTLTNPFSVSSRKSCLSEEVGAGGNARGQSCGRKKGVC